ncbi:hypothetical protein [Streptomyces sp. NPDC093225]|uniref:hypothetical protein n=1 Tax=Streptomyces sp. NPDC093225 TaxID=3366034 RepID=UPI00380D2022
MLPVEVTNEGLSVTRWPFEVDVHLPQGFSPTALPEDCETRGGRLVTCTLPRGMLRLDRVGVLVRTHAEPGVQPGYHYGEAVLRSPEDTDRRDNRQPFRFLVR